MQVSSYVETHKEGWTLGKDRDPAVVDACVLRASSHLTWTSAPPTLQGCPVVAVPAWCPETDRRSPGWRVAVVVEVPAPSALPALTGHPKVVAYVLCLRQYEDLVWRPPGHIVDVEGAWRELLMPLTTLDAVFPLFAVEWLQRRRHLKRKRHTHAHQANALPSVLEAAAKGIRLQASFEDQLREHLGQRPDDPGPEAFEPLVELGGEPDKYDQMVSNVRHKGREKQEQNKVLADAVARVLAGRPPRVAVVLDDLQLRTTQCLHAARTIVPNFGPRARIMRRQARTVCKGMAAGTSSSPVVDVWTCSMNTALRTLDALDANASLVDVVVADYCAKYDKYAAEDLELLFTSNLLAARSVLSLTVSFRANRSTDRRLRRASAVAAYIEANVTALAHKHGFSIDVLFNKNYTCCMLFMIFAVQRVRAPIC